MGIFQSGVADPTASILPTSMVDRLERRPDVAEATPLLLVVTGIRQSPAAVVFGAEKDGFFAERLVMTEGRRSLGPSQVLVGDQLAANKTAVQLCKWIRPEWVTNPGSTWSPLERNASSRSRSRCETAPHRPTFSAIALAPTS